jgi:hypothetical protein
MNNNIKERPSINPVEGDSKNINNGLNGKDSSSIAKIKRDLFGRRYIFLTIFLFHSIVYGIHLILPHIYLLLAESIPEPGGMDMIGFLLFPLLGIILWGLYYLFFSSLYVTIISFSAFLGRLCARKGYNASFFLFIASFNVFVFALLAKFPFVYQNDYPFQIYNTSSPFFALFIVIIFLFTTLFYKKAIKTFRLLAFSAIAMIAITMASISFWINVPYTEGEVLMCLKNRYNEDFAIKEWVVLNERDKVYVVYPINDETVEFYVGSDTTRSISIRGILVDTYTNALLLKDLPALKNIYPDISVKEFDINYTFIFANLTEIILSFNSYQDVENVSNKFIEVHNYVEDNISKYKAIDMQIKISIEIPSYWHTKGHGGYASYVPSSFTLNSQVIQNSITDSLIYNYRKEGNHELFNIPVNIREKYPVKDIGWGNRITKIYLNGELFEREQLDGVKATYSDGDLKFNGIDALIPILKSELEEFKLDYKYIKGKRYDYNEMEFILTNERSGEYRSNNYSERETEEIIYSYKKDNNIYILTQGDRGGISIYQYKNPDVNFLEDGWSSLSSQELNKYFGIKASYDFEKEILNLEYE